MSEEMYTCVECFVDWDAAEFPPHHNVDGDCVCPVCASGIMEAEDDYDVDPDTYDDSAEQLNMLCNDAGIRCSGDGDGTDYDALMGVY